MKSRIRFLFVPALAVAIQFAPAVRAESSTDKPQRQFRAERHARWASLTEDERTRLKAAHQKALSDPAVWAARDRLRQARREFRDALRPALLKADPSVQPILEKLRANRSEID